MFRYVISIGEDPDGWFVARITVQGWAGDGSKLIIEEIPRLEFWRELPKPTKDDVFRIMKPAYVARQIETAIERGWNHRGSPGQVVVSAQPESKPGEQDAEAKHD